MKIKALQDYSSYGVEFSEGLDSIDANFKVGRRLDYSGTEATKELIENWYQKNKVGFKELPQFSKETIDYLKVNFPETFKKLKNKLIELHKNPQGVKRMSKQQYWSGRVIDKLAENEIFVFGSNPEGRHGAGAAKAAVAFGAKYGQGRGLMGQSYGLITKNLNLGFVEKATGIKYEKEGFCSVSPEQIRVNVDELYECARNNPDKKFLVTYQYETLPNGTPKKSLNGYNSQEMLEMFVREEIPSNIIFHDSYRPHLEKILNNMNKQEDKPKEYTYFFHLTSPFSNFHPARFEYKNLTFISNEQFMMYSKAKTFGDEATANRIMNIHNEFQKEPGVFKSMEDKLCFQLITSFRRGEITREQILNDKASVDAWNTIHKKIKQLGREVKNYDDEIWNSKRAKVVFFGAREKFNQNPELKEVLMSTGETVMVEASPYDKLSTMQHVVQKLKEEFLAENKEKNKIKP